MLRDWWFNRFFLSIEKNGKFLIILIKIIKNCNIFIFLGNSFSPIRNIADELNTGWSKGDAVILSQHPNIKDSLCKKI